MKDLNHFIIFSHGFGVMKDSRGLFTDISSWLEDYVTVMFDYNKFSETDNTIFVKILSEQSKDLAGVVNKIAVEYPRAIVDIIAHSQGAIPVALTEFNIPINKIVLIAPSMDSGIDKTIRYFKRYPNTIINLEGESVLERKDGSKTIVPMEFWQDKQKYDPVLLYNKLAQKYNTTIIFASQDEVVANKSEFLAENIKVIYLDSDHNFTGVAREILKNELKKIF